MDNAHTGEDSQTDSSTSTSYSNPDLSRISGNLTDVMDDSGFSEEDRERRVKVGVMQQMLYTIFEAIGYYGQICYLCMGSLIEGTTANGMGSDSDSLWFSTSVKAYRNKENTKQTMLGLVFTRDENTPAGYTKLQPACQGCVINDPSDIYIEYRFDSDINVQADSKGRLLVAHFTDLSVPGFSDVKHGPADTWNNRPNEIDRDCVKAFVCNDITNEMEEWCMRDRTHDWPSKDIRDLFKTLGCFVVPIGHPSSTEKNLEWRMSFSLQERHLMWHLNPSQYHCFMLLKLIKTFLIKPKFGDVLNSYHCKTLLFYSIERHEQGIWIPENLIFCLRMCLFLLHEWISDKYIPNYFIPKENMFVKMDAALKGNYDNFKSFVAAICDNWMFLFYIAFNDIGNCFLAKLNGKEIHMWISDSMSRTVVDDSYLKRNLSSDTDAYMNQIQNALDYMDIVEAVLQSSRTCTRYTTFDENILDLYKHCFAGRTRTLDTPERANQLKEAYRFHVEANEKQPRLEAIMACKSAFQTMLGSVLAARYFQTGNAQYLLESDTCLELGKSLNPMASMLVKATVLLKQSLHDTSDVALNAAEIISKGISMQCVCHKYITYYNMVGVRKLYTLPEDATLVSNTEDISNLLCRGCLYFTRCEYDILPEVFTFEAYRSFGITTNTLAPWEKQSLWFEPVSLEPITYLYYLQFLNNEHNNPGKAAVALQKLENTLFDRIGRSDWHGHIDTWLNMLGDIFVKKGWTRLALRCFRYSDMVRPLHNAVRWHIMFLLFSPPGGIIQTVGIA